MAKLVWRVKLVAELGPSIVSERKCRKFWVVVLAGSMSSARCPLCQ